MNTKSFINLYSDVQQMILLNDSLYTFKLLLQKDHAYIISGKLKSNNLSKDQKAILTVDFLTNEIRQQEYKNYGLNFSNEVGAYRYIYPLNDDGSFHIKFKSRDRHEILCTISSWKTNEKLYLLSELAIEEVEIDKSKNHNLVSEKNEYSKEKILEKFNKSIKKYNTIEEFDSFNAKKQIIEYPVFAIALGTSNINPFIFCPRKGLNEIEFKIPIDWNMDPFKDSNWRFQFHAWRMLGNALFTFEKNQDVTLLDKVLIIISDWYHFTIIEGKENDFTWSDMATGIRSSVIAYLINRLLKTNSSKKLTDKEKVLLFNLAKIHIEKLFIQKLAKSNHGIFQLHGLIMLLDCFNSNNIYSEEIKRYAYKNMARLFHSQFYFDGMQSENSDEYHRFMVYVFSNIIDANIYDELHSELKILEKAKANNDYLLFPNNEGIMMGDTGYFKSKSKRITKKVHLFRNSGYLYFNETKNSMLFITSAFKNIIHKHADHFNFLWYEDDMNILVDAGKYSYDKSEKREYYISSRAHNVIVVDDKNYTINTKNYFSTALKYYKKEDYGYSVRLSKYWDEFDVKHNRYFLYGPEKFLIVIDILNSEKEHKYQQVFHFNEKLVIERTNDIYTTKLNSKKMDIVTKTVHRKYTTSLVSGQKDPVIQGWRSINYNKEVPNYLISNEVYGKNEIFVTGFFLRYDGMGTSPLLEVNKNNSEIEIVISDGRKLIVSI